MPDCVSAPVAPVSHDSCRWERGKSDIYSRLDEIRSGQIHTNIMLDEHLPSIRSIKKMKIQVGIMWGISVAIGSLVALALIGAFMSLILKGA